MGRIVRYHLMGSWIVFWLLCITAVGIPVAFLYFLNGTVRLDSEVSDPEQFIADFQAGKLKTE